MERSNAQSDEINEMLEAEAGAIAFTTGCTINAAIDTTCTTSCTVDAAINTGKPYNANPRHWLTPPARSWEEIAL